MIEMPKVKIGDKIQVKMCHIEYNDNHLKYYTWENYVIEDIKHETLFFNYRNSVKLKDYGKLWKLVDKVKE